MGKTSVLLEFAVWLQKFPRFDGVSRIPFRLRRASNASQIISFDDKELAVANSSIDFPRPYPPYGLSAIPEYDNHIVTDGAAIVNRF